MTALEDLKSDESFVDVTLSCDGETIQVRTFYLVFSHNNQTLKKVEHIILMQQDSVMTSVLH